MALRANADQEGWPLEQIVLHFDNPRCASDDQPTFDSHRSNRRIACSIEPVGYLYERQRSQLIGIANRHLAAWRSLVTTHRASGVADCSA